MRIALVLVAGAVLAASWVEAAEDTAARGKTLYTESRCTMCHSVAGKGNPKGPQDDVGSRLTPAELRKWLLEPKAMAAKAKAARKPPMPSFETLKREDLDTLVAYLATLKSPPPK
jgi:mono/diheme cytochrome c family protein